MKMHKRYFSKLNNLKLDIMFLMSKYFLMILLLFTVDIYAKGTRAKPLFVNSFEQSLKIKLNKNAKAGEIGYKFQFKYPRLITKDAEKVYTGLKKFIPPTAKAIEGMELITHSNIIDGKRFDIDLGTQSYLILNKLSFMSLGSNHIYYLLKDDNNSFFYVHEMNTPWAKLEQLGVVDSELRKALNQIPILKSYLITFIIKEYSVNEMNKAFKYYVNFNPSEISEKVDKNISYIKLKLSRHELVCILSFFKYSTIKVKQVNKKEYEIVL